jgi:hypothetical protein
MLKRVLGQFEYQVESVFLFSVGWDWLRTGCLPREENDMGRVGTQPDILETEKPLKRCFS